MTSPDAPLLRGEGLTAWRQIADALSEEIGRGQLAAGSQLPTEAALAGRFGVNRHTVRRALATLAERGLVRATQGRGTFVEQGQIPYPIGRRTRFSENVSRAGREARGDLIEARTVPADGETAEALGISPGDPVLEMVTLHRADGTPISMARISLPLPRFSGFESAYARLASITRAFAECGIEDYTRLSTRIGARGATAEEAARLDIAPGRPLLMVSSVNVDADGECIEASRSLFCADRVELLVE
ncbi:MAG: phosphonate metabolism transcriptional regulator PhnF [Methylobacterium sp.]|nr:phosphonate metabolism transcriptional regulator PhnF [Methylobacterium sp.]